MKDNKISIASRREKENPFSIGHPWFLPSLYWTKTLPFLENSRAVLIHRPRFIDTIRRRRYQNGPFEEEWLAIENWCGNNFTGKDKFTFHASPPSGGIVCQRCEEAAVRSGEKTSAELAGKHVHVGTVMAVRTCCPQ